MNLAEKIKDSVDLNIRDELPKILTRLNDYMLQRAQLKNVTHFIEEMTVSNQFINNKAVICASSLSRDSKLLVYAETGGMITIYDLTSQNITKQISVTLLDSLDNNFSEFSYRNRFIIFL